MRIKMRSCQRPQVLAYLCHGPRRTIEAIRPERIPYVNHREDACNQRNLFTFQAKRVTAAVPLFMMCARYVQCRAQVDDWRKHLEGIYGMFFHDKPFCFSQLLMFE